MKVLIADKLQEHGLAALRDSGFDVVVKSGLKEAELIEAVRSSKCEVLVVRSTKVTAPLFDAADDLKLVIRAGSGVDTIDVPAATKRGVKVCNCPGANSVAVAELVIGLMIALDRRIVDETDDLRRGVWNKKEYSKARGLKGRTLGIVGLGRIGFEVAKRAFAFDMKIVYTDVVDRADAERQFAATRTTLDALLRESDFVTLHVPGGKDTTRLIGGRELGLMKRTAFVINCSRGGVVDEEALSDAVRSGRIAGAALDVYEIEPAAADTAFKDPVAGVPRVYGTHHVGASTDQAQEAVADDVVKILRTFVDTGRLLNCVNAEKPAPASMAMS